MTRDPIFARPSHAGGKPSPPPDRSMWKRIGARLRGCWVAGFHRAGSLAVFDFSDLPELQRMFGAAAARHLVARIVGVLAALDPLRGRVLRPTPTTFVVVLPTDDAGQAHELVRSALGGSFAIESDWRGEEIVVVPDFLVRPLGGPDRSIDLLCQQMRSEIVATQQYEKRRDRHLRMEGESRCPASRARRQRAIEDAPAAQC